VQRRVLVVVTKANESATVCMVQRSAQATRAVSKPLYTTATTTATSTIVYTDQSRGSLTLHLSLIAVVGFVVDTVVPGCRLHRCGTTLCKTLIEKGGTHAQALLLLLLQVSSTTGQLRAGAACFTKQGHSLSHCSCSAESLQARHCYKIYCPFPLLPFLSLLQNTHTHKLSNSLTRTLFLSW
jgi:hypothetical protein